MNGQEPYRFPWKPYAVLLAVFLALDSIAYNAPAALGQAVAMTASALVLVLALGRVDLGGLVFLILVILADDISRLDPLETPVNLLTAPIAGVAVVNLVALAYIALATLFAAIAWANKPQFFRLTLTDIAVIAIAGAYTLALLHGLPAALGNPRGAINDLNLPIMVCGFYFIVRIHANTPERRLQLWRWLVAAMSVKATIWACWFAVGLGFAFGDTIKVSNESGRVLLVLILIWGLILQSASLKLPARDRIAGLVLTAAAGINILVQSQRSIWLMAGFGVAMLLLLGSPRDKLRWIVGAGVMAAVIVFAVLVFKPDAFLTIGYHARTLAFWAPDKQVYNTSIVIRVHEFQNIHATLVDHRNLILGEGPGSVFTDEYHPIPFALTTGDFTAAEIQKREFQNAHGLVQNLLLNLGYGGTAAFLLALAAIYLSAILNVFRTRDPAHRAIALALAAFFPAMAYSAWSPKNNILIGLFAGFIGLYAASKSLELSPSPVVCENPNGQANQDLEIEGTAP
jgi:hypothetical protein